MRTAFIDREPYGNVVGAADAGVRASKVVPDIVQVGPRSSPWGGELRRAHSSLPSIAPIPSRSRFLYRRLSRSRTPASVVVSRSDTSCRPSASFAPASSSSPISPAPTSSNTDTLGDTFALRSRNPKASKGSNPRKPAAGALPQTTHPQANPPSSAALYSPAAHRTKRKAQFFSAHSGDDPFREKTRARPLPIE